MKSIEHSSSFNINQPVDIVFPLFSPEGEKAWVPGWDYENIMGTTQLSEDYVFLTRSHDHASTDAVWIVKKYIPEEWIIQFYRVEPEEKIGVVTVQCFSIGDNITRVEVTYQYIPLSEEGQSFVNDFSSEAYEEFIDEWKDLLYKYVE